MTVHFPTDGVLADFADQPDRPLTARELERMDLRCRCLALHRRTSIATIKWEHGLLLEDEQDALLLEGKELLAEIELWRQCK
jgi:hypothetical protein